MEASKRSKFVTKNTSIILLVIGFAFVFALFGKFLSASRPLRVLGESSGNMNAFVELAKSGSDSQFGIDSIEFDACEFQEAYEKANYDFGTRAGFYDIVLQYNFSLAPFSRNKYVLTTEELANLCDKSVLAFEKDLFPSVWREIGQYQVTPASPLQKVGYPFAANTMVLVYNKKIFAEEAERFKQEFNQELKVASTWEDYHKHAKFFTDHDKRRYGVCVHGKADGHWIYYEWCNIAYSMGGGVMSKRNGWEGDSSTPLTLADPKTVRATEYFASLRDFSVPEAEGIDADKQIENLITGKAVMGLVWSDYLFKLTPIGGNVKEDEFGFAPIPGDKSMIAGGAFFVNRSSKNAEFAARYISHLLSRDSQVKLVKKGLCSPCRFIYQDEKLKTEIPYLDAIGKSLAEGRATYMLPIKFG